MDQYVKNQKYFIRTALVIWEKNEPICALFWNINFKDYYKL